MERGLNKSPWQQLLQPAVLFMLVCLALFLSGLSLMASLTRECAPGVGKVPHHARQAMQQLSVPVGQMHAVPLAATLERIIAHGSISQLKQELQKSHIAIPHILHYVYLAPEGGTLTRAMELEIVDSRLVRSCQYQHAHWIHLHWDQSAIETLIRQQYPSYLDLMYLLEPGIMRANFARYLVLHFLGGFTLEEDVECFRATDDMLAQADIVLQATAFEGANTLAMASRPGVSFWPDLLRLVQQRRADTNETISENELTVSGPNALSDALETYFGMGTKFWEARNGDNKVKGYIVRVWPRDTWFCPCFMNEDCYYRIAQQHADSSLPSDVTGLHVFGPH